MKKLLIVNNNMHIGGVQKALVNLLWSIHEEYEITLLLFYKGGEYIKEIPPEVQVIEPNGAYRYLGMTKHDCAGVTDRLGRSFFAALARVFGRRYARIPMGLGQKQLGEYDAAISYLHNSGNKAFYGGCNEFVLKHVSAKKKITFLHCDYLLCGADTSENAKQYREFDRIAACSQGCADAFLKANPALRDRLVVVPNCHRFDRIREDAMLAPVRLAENRINIVTIARLGKEKGVERALRVIAALGPLKEKIHYYIVGDGAQKTQVLSVMESENLHDCVTLCGMLENPYAYLKAADLLLIPSYSEAAPLVIGEAACLGTPVLSTETSSAREMIEDTGYGWVCENSEEAMQEALERLLRNPALLSLKGPDGMQKRLDNQLALLQFAEMIGS